jgi:RHS repeat-associated protein
MITIERDELCRWQKMISPYLQEIFPKDSYDSVGNLTHIQFISDHKLWERNYVYDDLNQLQKENETEYLFDSLGSCAQKQGIDYKINTLSQVIQDTKGSYSYDANGNLLNKQGVYLRYDSLDRLVGVEKKGLQIEYAYDNLHRRIWKKVNGKRVDFIWDGDDEIGSIENEKIKEFRLLGEGFEAEVGSSLLFELGNKRYIPIHDHRGNIVQLIHVKSEKAVRTTYYSAFGQPVMETGSTHSPWTFCSKREDPETNFIYFGRRYYMPDLERWLTADPAGFIDGPNLYSYVHNNPLTRFDAYGLFDAQQKQFISTLGRACFNPTSYVAPYFFSGVEYVGKNLCLTPGRRDLLEAIGRWGSGHGPFWQKAEYHSNYSRVSLYPGKELDGTIFVHHNGMKTSLVEAMGQAKEISETHGDVPVHLHYNGDLGTITNLYQAAISKIGMSQAYDRMSKKHYMTLDKESTIKVTAHSQGGAYLNVLGKTLPSDIKNRMDVNTFGSATIIARDVFGKVTNYVSEKDLVPCTSIFAYGKALFGGSENITFLKPYTDNIFEEHSFLGPTYRHQLIDDGQRFREKES